MLKINTMALALVLSLSSCTVPEKEVEIKAADVPVSPSSEPVLSEGQRYVQQVMTACGAKLSPAKTLILSEQISRIGESLFRNKEDRNWFYLLICIESRYSNDVKSTAGAVGLTQVMPKYAPEFAKACGLGELDPKDLADSQVNLLIGACRFKELMAYYNGDPTLALAAYNSGMDSPTVRKAVSSDIRTGHPETVGYLAAAFVLEQRMKREKDGKRPKTKGSNNTP
jgi:hypothetical protein